MAYRAPAQKSGDPSSRPSTATQVCGLGESCLPLGLVSEQPTVGLGWAPSQLQAGGAGYILLVL